MGIDKELYEAAGKGDVSLVKQLIKKGADVNSRHGYYEGVPLHHASKNDQSEVVRELVVNNAIVNIKDTYGNTPLHDAVEMGNSGVIEILVQNRCNMDIANMHGDAPIHIACVDNNDEITKILLKNGNPTDIPNKTGDTPLHIACRNNNLVLIKILLENGSRTDIRNKDGKRAFDLIENEQEKKSALNLKEEIEKNKQAGIPIEIKNMDQMSVDLFIGALNNKKQKIFHIRIMVVGKYGVGKSTFTIGLLNDDTLPYSPGSTNGISIYVGRCRIDRETGKWHVGNIVQKRPSTKYNKLIKVLQNITSEDVKERQEASEGNYKPSTAKKHKHLPNQTTENLEGIKHEDQSVETSVDPKQMLKETIEYSESNEESEKEFVDVEMWDFGGQEVFYTSHQTFLSGRCLYTLMIDLRDMYDEQQKGYLDFWINTIIIYAKGKIRGFPKIIVIGTHLDKIPIDERDYKLNCVFVKIKKQFTGHPAEDHLIIDPQYCLDATDKGSLMFAKIRRLIYSISEKYPTWGEERPAYWIPLERDLLDLREKQNRKIISFEEILEMNKATPCQDLSKNEIPVFLEFHHSLGSWLYFKEESLNKYVILDPKWLIDALSSIITDEYFCENDDLKMEIWTSLSENGLVQEDRIHKLWERQKYSDFGKYQDHLLKTMEKFDLMVKPKSYENGGVERSVDFYLIPCMLRKDIPVDISQNVQKTGGIKLIFEFEGNFLPQAIFFRLLGCCIKMWPILYFKGKMILFSSLAGFSLDDCNRMYLQKFCHKILLVLEPVKSGNIVSPFLCEGVRHFIEQSLNRLIQTYDCYHTVSNDKDKGHQEIFHTVVPCCLEHLDCVTEINCWTKGEKLNCEHHAIKKIKHTLYPCFKHEELVPRRLVVKECDSTCKGLDVILLDINIKEVDLARLARRWPSDPGLLTLAFHLDLCDELKSIDEDRYYGFREKTFHLLLKWNIFNRGNYGMLQRELVEYGKIVGLRMDHLLCKVVKIKDLYSEMKCCDVLSKHMFREVTSKLLNELADRLMLKDGYQLCLELGVTACQLDRIRNNYPNQSAMHIREGLQRWKRKFEGDCREALFVLSVALDEVGIGNGPLFDILKGCCSQSISGADTTVISTAYTLNSKSSPDVESHEKLTEKDIHSSKILDLEVEKVKLEIKKSDLEICKLKEEIELLKLKQKYYKHINESIEK